MPAPRHLQLAFLTIGQAPRHDLSGAIEHALPPHVEVRHVGALDGLDRPRVHQRFAPLAGQPELISRLADGGTVTLSAHAIGVRLQQCITEIERDGADIIVLLCTGEFPGLATRGAWLIEPDAVVCATVTSLLRGAQAGILVPLAEQAVEASAKWRALDKAALFAAASPYAQEPHELIEAARSLRRQGAQALVLDCMGYSPSHAQALREAGIDIPILVSGSVLAGALGAFL